MIYLVWRKNEKQCEMAWHEYAKCVKKVQKAHMKVLQHGIEPCTSKPGAFC